MFKDKLLPKVPPKYNVDYHIKLLPRQSPLAKVPYLMNIVQLEEVNAQITELLECNQIQPSYSLYSTPILLVKKKDGTWWMCINYQLLNCIMIKN